MGYRIFKNREDAGNRLAVTLEKYKNSHPLILGIPRGGVEIAYYIARHLKTEFSIIISKKISYPHHPEYGVGAISEGDEIYIPDYGEYNSVVLQPVVTQLRDEIRRRVIMYREGKPLPEIAGRTVILVDDGIATGVTLVPPVRLCKKLNAAKVVIAAPVSGRNLNPDLYEADELNILYQIKEFYGVGMAYEDFSQLDDEDVLRFLKKTDHIKE